MKMVTRLCVIVLSMTLVVAVTTARADDVPIPISANQAFDAVADQVDPVTGDPATVRIVDLRSAAEYYWVGTCAQVNRIVTKYGADIVPDKGKAKLTLGGRLYQYKVKGLPKLFPVKYVESIETGLLRADIDGVVNIPYKTWVDDYCEGDLCDKRLDDKFKERIEGLAYDDGVEVVILMCRSGGRTSACVVDFDTLLFTAVYEIDRPDKDGRGGFEGTTYGNFFNGYRGFPGRATAVQEHGSVSWCDAGLPIVIGACPSRPVGLQ
ncbi:MAG: rhodanese-like domain-containing protein [Thermodesulfobacteriota bacterium]|nr:rhodanese-like domain-containing protein [Thermodesulfobacteriota bacterium]